MTTPLTKLLERHAPEISYHPYLEGYICQSTHWTGSGLTRARAITSWVDHVRRTASPGGFNVTHARRIAMYLFKHPPAKATA